MDKISQQKSLVKGKINALSAKPPSEPLTSKFCQLLGAQDFIQPDDLSTLNSRFRGPKNGVHRTDLYQMLAYAIRFEVEEAILLYPNTINGNQENPNQLIIKDSLANGKEISIKVFQLPILNKALLNQPLNPSLDLSELFDRTRKGLKEIIQEILEINQEPSNY